MQTNRKKGKEMLPLQAYVFSEQNTLLKVFNNIYNKCAKILSLRFYLRNFLTLPRIAM